MVTCFISILQESTVHSIELPKAKNCISALFAGEITNYIYKVRASAFETLLTFFKSWFFMISVPTFYYTNTFMSETHKPKSEKQKNNNNSKTTCKINP